MKRALAVLAFASFAACADAPAADGGIRTGASAAAVPGSAVVEVATASALRPIALRVPDMSCRLCARPIEHHLWELGVQEVETDLKTKWVTGRFDPEHLTPDAIREAVEKIRFRVVEVRVG